ncbi:hypothetical protein EFS54_08445 [Periweissella beninensis]|nr:hypothetical protein [Periweissella beninensis]
MVNTILKEADLFCPNSVRINFTIYRFLTFFDNHLCTGFLIVQLTTITPKSQRDSDLFGFSACQSLTELLHSSTVNDC